MGAYVKGIWVDKNVQYPNMFTDELGTVKTFTANPGTVTNPGTAITAVKMNNIEQGVYDMQVNFKRSQSMGGGI